MPEPWRVIITRPATRDLRRLDPRLREQVIGGLDRLAAGDPRCDLVKLTDVNPPAWRLRVGGMRVVFDRDEKARAIIVLSVGHRGGTYR